MSELDYDVLVIGQGLAGTTLAWQLHWLGQHVLVIDREAATSASRIAAGLVTPLTGQRFAANWRFNQLFPIAKAFYEQVESQTGHRCFSCQPAVRLFTSAGEADSFAGQANDPAVAALLTACGKVTATPLISAPYGGAEMAPAARLDVPAYLDASRDFFAAQGSYRGQPLDPVRDVALTPHGAVVAGIGSVSNVIFCLGAEAVYLRWFDDVEFEPAKGEILTVRLPGLRETRVVHRGIWLAPLGHERFSVGATYVAGTDAVPSSAGRQELIGQLSEFVNVAPVVEQHHAAVRPTVKGRLPLVGRHPRYPQVGFFNGLGSKGALRAPYAASQFAKALVRGDQVDREILYQPNEPQRVSPQPTPRRLTESAHQEVAAVLRVGDTAVDATVGNGLDTLHLARCVGRDGRVLGFDIQREAIDRTQLRLDAEGVTQARLHQASHQRLADVVPEQLHGNVGAIMFNLGYLPRGDKAITTQPSSTLPAIEFGLRLLATPGVMTILAYTGHPGGLEEVQAVERLLQGCSTQSYQVVWPDYDVTQGAPRLYVVRRRAPGGCWNAG